MERFVVLPSMYNIMKLKTQKFIGQEFQKARLKQNPTTKLYHLGRQKNCLLQQTLQLTKICQFLILRFQSHKQVYNGVETGVLLSDLAEQLGQQNDFLVIYFTSIDATGISPVLVLNRNAKSKERKKWVFFKIWTSKAAESVHTESCCLWLFAQPSEC